MLKVRFYVTKSGRSPVEELLAEGSPKLRADFLDAVIRLEAGETLPMPLARNLSSTLRGLFELRLRDLNSIFRIFFVLRVSDAIYFLHGFKKKSQKIPKQLLNLVLKRAKEI